MKQLQIGILILAVFSTGVFSFRHFAAAQDGAAQTPLSQYTPPTVAVGGQRLELDAVIPELAKKRIVCTHSWSIFVNPATVFTHFPVSTFSLFVLPCLLPC